MKVCASHKSANWVGTQHRCVKAQLVLPNVRCALLAVCALRLRAVSSLGTVASGLQGSLQIDIASTSFSCSFHVKCEAAQAVH